jgi:uncharacterized 2Fe-2S/4Fe-4S cluster protein (DUF4445 family)
MSDTSPLTRWSAEPTLAPPSLEDNTADGDRLLGWLTKHSGLEHARADLVFLGELPTLLRQHDFRVRCSFFRDRQGLVLTGLMPPDDRRPFLGLALDIGTTKYAARLVDLDSRETLAEISRSNPQSVHGTDILSRIHYADRGRGTAELQRLLVDDLNEGIREVCDRNGWGPWQISNIVAAGNTAMTHFFLGLPTRWMIREPYIPAVNDPDLLRARELGIEAHPGARVMCFPNIGSYFGGDILSGIVYSGMHRSDEVAILVDVGTNAEVVLGNRDWMIACAGAAGPALEGGVSEIGKQAGPGIIDRVRYDPETSELEIHTIGDLPPHGVCGSGIIDLAAGLFRAGLLDFRGKFVPQKQPERFLELDGIQHFVLVEAHRSGTGRNLLIGQPEIDSLIRSKAAMYTILETLTGSVGIGFEDISRFYVAGAFGNFIDPASAITIGMLPDLSLETYCGLGNSSIGGASEILQRPETFPEVREVKERITYLELNVNQEFMNRFSAAKFLPHTEGSKFPSVTSA